MLSYTLQGETDQLLLLCILIYPGQRSFPDNQWINQSANILSPGLFICNTPASAGCQYHLTVITEVILDRKLILTPPIILTVNVSLQSLFLHSTFHFTPCHNYAYLQDIS